MPDTAPPTVVIGVGMPTMLLLERFGAWVHDAYGTMPYLVGSSAVGKQWRDVDVRLVLPDEQFDHLFPGGARGNGNDPRWTLACAALSALARDMTGGLPVDFQIQRRSYASKRFGEMFRYPLGVVVTPPACPPPPSSRS